MKLYKGIFASFAFSFSILFSANLMAQTLSPQYWGGFVLSQPVVNVVFWGQSVNKTAQEKMGPFISSLLNSNYMDVLNQQYNTVGIVGSDGLPGTNQNIGHGQLGGPFTINPKDKNKNIWDGPDAQQITKEISYQISIGVLPAVTPNSFYMVYLSADITLHAFGGTQCETGAIYHGAVSQAGVLIPYAVFPDFSICGWQGFHVTGQFLTYYTSVELQSGITDPNIPVVGTPKGDNLPDAWVASDGLTEVGAECLGVSYNSWLNSAKGENYLVEPIWLNSTSACTKQNFK